jgi:putative ABC transport system ATP-binding protein
MASPPLIQFQQVSKVYGRGEATIRALDTVDLVIEKNEFVAIMGPSGSGKSTAMNILGCLDVPSSGEYLFQDIKTSELDRGQHTLLRRHMLGFVFQGFNLLARTSAVENVELPLVYRGMEAGERRRLANIALAQVGLSGRESHTTQELSGGQQQRVNGPSSPARRCCSPTNRPATSTPRPARRSWN